MKWKSWKFSFSCNVRIHISRHRAGDRCHVMPWRQQSRTVQGRGPWMTRPQLCNRTSLTSQAHRWSLSKWRELALSSFHCSKKIELLQLALGLFCFKWTELCIFSACLLVFLLQVIRVFALPNSRFSSVVVLLSPSEQSSAPSDRSCCTAQLVFSFSGCPFPFLVEPL